MIWRQQGCYPEGVQDSLLPMRLNTMRLGKARICEFLSGFASNFSFDSYCLPPRLNKPWLFWVDNKRCLLSLIRQHMYGCPKLEMAVVLSRSWSDGQFAN